MVIKMKTCPDCGYQNFDVKVECEKCGAPLKASPLERLTVNIPQKAASEPKLTLCARQNAAKRRAAKGFMIVSCVAAMICALTTFVGFIIALAIKDVVGLIAFLVGTIVALALIGVTVFMTHSYCDKIARGETVGVAFMIVTLIFISPIAGILMLCDNGF